MARLEESTEVLLMDGPARSSGVKFGSTRHHSSEVKLDLVRWMDMGRPGQITVTIKPVRSTAPPPRESV